MDNKFWENNPLDRYSPVPLYHQLSDILANDIKDHVLQPGDPLPSENSLMKQYGVSRFVVRQTLNYLSRQGLITTLHGRGSFVCFQKLDKPLDVLQSYHEVMRKSGITVDLEIVSKTIMYPPEDIATQLELAAEDKVFHLERIARVDSVPINILISNIALNSRDRYNLLQFSGGSLYNYLEDNYGICLYRSQSSIEVVFAGEFESRLLDITRGTILLQITGIVYEKGGRPVEYSRVVYPATMFRFRFDSYKRDRFNQGDTASP